MIDIDTLRQLCNNNRIKWSEHVALRMLRRRITKQQVIAAINDGRIIEQYPDDYPFPSCLILHIDGQALHVVCGLAPSDVWIITAYYPGLDKWEPDMKTRRRL